jgi:hypothetical protein
MELALPIRSQTCSGHQRRSRHGRLPRLRLLSANRLLLEKRRKQAPDFNSPAWMDGLWLFYSYDTAVAHVSVERRLL